MFFLAKELGMTVRQLMAGLDSSELAEWMAYYNLEHYRKVITDKAMSAEQRTKLLKDTLFRKQLHGK